MLIAGIAISLAAAAIFATLARRSNSREANGARMIWLAGSLAASLAGLGLLMGLAIMDAPPPDTHAYAAITMAIIGYVILHTLLGVMFAAYTLARCRAGFVSSLRSTDMRGTAIWQLYTAITGIGGLALIILAPGGLA